MTTYPRLNKGQIPNSFYLGCIFFLSKQSIITKSMKAERKLREFLKCINYRVNFGDDHWQSLKEHRSNKVLRACAEPSPCQERSKLNQ